LNTGYNNCNISELNYLACILATENFLVDSTLTLIVRRALELELLVNFWLTFFESRLESDNKLALISDGLFSLFETSGSSKYLSQSASMLLKRAAT
jgi:hypothetical protein